jgi:dTDP-glucose 4,6-dehydratase
MVRAFHATHGLPILISNCSNNYGERQHPEKLLPKAITNLLTGKKIPVYGAGQNIRDWLYVGDHVKAINTILHYGRRGETYNIGGDSEMRNIDIVKDLIEIHLVDRVTDGKEIPSASTYQSYIEFVEDRKGHDFRYAINHNKLTRETGWKPEATLHVGLKITYEYYKNLLG